MKTIYFDDVLSEVDKMLKKCSIHAAHSIVIRDIYGRIRIAITDNSVTKANKNDLCTEIKKLGPYAVEEHQLLFPSDLIKPDLVFKNPDIQDVYLPPSSEISFRLLDRTVVGQDWLRPEKERRGRPNIPRLAFYGFKGGVGRTSAVAAVSYELARTGKNVLVFDFDLESPGLGSMLLPAENYSEYGVVDWLIEDAVQNTDELFVRKMLANSPLAQKLDGTIHVVPAMGAKTDNQRFDPQYVSKLSRIYADIPESTETFSGRLHRLVKTMEMLLTPDVVLIDCRAGLHDLSAGSIVRIADESFLFIVDTPQSWEGYRMLFSHWQLCPKLLKNGMRDKFNIVHALIQRTSNVQKEFVQKSHSLFTDTIYEISENEENDTDLYNFDINDVSSPHYPVDIYWDKSLTSLDFGSFMNTANTPTLSSNYASLFTRIAEILEAATE